MDMSTSYLIPLPVWRSTTNATTKRTKNSTNRQVLEPLFNNTGRAVGAIVRESGITKLLKQRVNPEKHRLLRPEGYATDVAHLAKLRQHGGTLIELDLTTGEVLTATLDVFEEKGITINRGYGVQRVLPDRYWLHEEPRAKQARARTGGGA